MNVAPGGGGGRTIICMLTTHLCLYFLLVSKLVGFLLAVQGQAKRTTT